VLKTLKNSNNLVVLTILWLASSVLIFLPGFLDNGQLPDVLGATVTVLVFILIPGALLGLLILKIKEPVTALVVGASLLIAAIIPLNAFLNVFQLGWILLIMLIAISVYSIFKAKDFLKKKSVIVSEQINIQVLILALLFIVGFLLLIRQSLYVPANNLDQFLVWPDTYNALAQAGEINHHGPRIFPFVADSQVPLKYHWGAFSLGSFISLLGSFSLVVSIFKTQFLLLGLLYLGLLYFAGKLIGQSWIGGLFAVVLGGLTIYPSFPEFNDQIGLARLSISSTSMPQFTANIFAVLAIYFIYSVKNKKLSNNLNFLILFIVTLTATLSKGPVGLLIVICAIMYVVMQYKQDLKKNIIYIILPTLFGFIIGYSQITSSNSSNGKNGTSLWLNPTDTFKSLTDGYGLELSTKSILIFLLLFVISFAPLKLAIFASLKQSNAQDIWPLIVASFAGISGMLLFETWGDSQFFLLSGAVPFIAILLAASAFYKETTISTEKLLLLTLGVVGQPLIFKLLSSFVPSSNLLKTFLLWILSVVVVWAIALVFARVNNRSAISYLLVASVGIGMFSGLTRFDQKAFSLPEHPYSISLGTASIAEYLRKNSDPNDLIATNRHCAGIEENQTCTARQFALSALSERRVFLEGWSYTTCPLAEPILNQYWKADNWKLNQDFFTNPTVENWSAFSKSGIDWLVVDSTRPSAPSYTEVAELVKTDRKVSLWKITDPYTGIVETQSNPCSQTSTLISK
jgi:hypothetical protein